SLCWGAYALAAAGQVGNGVCDTAHEMRRGSIGNPERGDDLYRKPYSDKYTRTGRCAHACGSLLETGEPAADTGNGLRSLERSCHPVQLKEDHRHQHTGSCRGLLRHLDPKILIQKTHKIQRFPEADRNVSRP